MKSTCRTLLVTLREFWAELSRRKTANVFLTYSILLAAVIGPASDILGGLGAPDWMLRVLIYVLFAAFPLVLVFSWIFDLTPEGLKRTEDCNPSERRDCHEQTSEYSLVKGEDQPDELAREMHIEAIEQITVMQCAFSIVSKNFEVESKEFSKLELESIAQLIDHLCTTYPCSLLNREGANFDLLFGHPKPVENEGFAAVCAAVSLLRSTENMRFRLNNEVEIAVSIGLRSNSLTIEGAEQQLNPDTLSGDLKTVTWLRELASPQSVLMDRYTFKLLRDRVRCCSKGTFTNSSSGEETEVFELIAGSIDNPAVSSVAPAPNLIVGREVEIELLRERWQRALEGEFEITMLRGEDGIGKSALVDELVRDVKNRGDGHVISLACSPIESQLSLDPLRHYAESARAELQMKWPCNLITEKSPEEFDLLAANPGLVIKCFIAMAGEKRLLLVIEDIHWADPATLEFAGTLAGLNSEFSGLCLITTRPGAVFDWESCANVTALDLENLSKKSSRQLINQVLGSTRIHERLMDSIVSEAGGNPLILEELTRAVMESMENDGNLFLTEVRPTEYLKRKMLSKINKLGAGKSILQLCSLLGSQVSESVLFRICEPLKPETISRHLKNLVHRGYLSHSGVTPRSI